MDKTLENIRSIILHGSTPADLNQAVAEARKVRDIFLTDSDSDKRAGQCERWSAYKWVVTNTREGLINQQNREVLFTLPSIALA